MNNGLTDKHPCNPGVIQDKVSELKGSYVSLPSLGSDETIEAYLTPALPSNRLRIGIVVFFDIYGFAIPNVKYIVDYLSDQGFDAILPNFFHNGGWDPSRSRDSPEWTSWISDKFTPDCWASVAADLGGAVSYLKELGCTAIGAVGYCWGGKAATMSAKTGLLNAVVSIHGARHTIEDLDSNIPMSFITVHNDASFKEEDQAQIAAALKEKRQGRLVYYSGVTHGFAVRGDYTIPEIKQKADQAKEETVEFFKMKMA